MLLPSLAKTLILVRGRRSPKLWLIDWKYKLSEPSHKTKKQTNKKREEKSISEVEKKSEKEGCKKKGSVQMKKNGMMMHLGIDIKEEIGKYLKM